MTTAATPESVRDEAIGRARRHAPAEWIAAAHRCVRLLAIVHPTMTSDDVWSTIGQPPEPRALGGVMRAAADEGWITATDEYVPSLRPECHCRPQRVWRRGVRASTAIGDGGVPKAETDLAAMRGTYSTKS